MGMWQNDQRNGEGVVVTVDGVYYEGKFVQNKLAVSFELAINTKNMKLFYFGFPSVFIDELFFQFLMFEMRFTIFLFLSLLLSTLPAPFISESCIEKKINLNFYFHTSWCFKRFYEGLDKTF